MTPVPPDAAALIQRADQLQRRVAALAPFLGLSADGDTDAREFVLRSAPSLVNDLSALVTDLILALEAQRHD